MNTLTLDTDLTDRLIVCTETVDVAVSVLTLTSHIGLAADLGDVRDLIQQIIDGKVIR